MALQGSNRYLILEEFLSTQALGPTNLVFGLHTLAIVNGKEPPIAPAGVSSYKLALGLACPNAMPETYVTCPRSHGYLLRYLFVAYRALSSVTDSPIV
jgi:hypothetical protein